MRRAVFVMAAMAAFASGAHAAQCPPPGAERLPVPLPVALDVHLPQPTYRNSLSRAQLAAISPKGGGGPNVHHAGLTQTDTHFSVRPTLRFYRLAGGQLCAQLARVEASWKMTRLQVDVASEYRPGTCPYREVWEHENEHVAISQRFFTEAERALKARLAQLAEQIGPRIVSGPPEQTSKEVVRQLMDGAQVVLDRYKAETQRANAVIDSPDNYRRVSSRCADW